MKRILFLYLLIASPLYVWGQSFSVSGSLADAEDQSPLVGATIILTNVADTAKQHYAVADIDGHFLINGLTDAFYKMRINSIGYKPYLQYVRVNQPETKLGTLAIMEDPKILDELEVEGQVIAVEQKGDTTQFNALAYKTNPDANAEDLIAKMPGIIINQGKVQAQGEDVKKVLVDGKEFFSNDPTLALRNIPAEIIDKIQVFDEISEQARFSGFDDGNTTKTINIVTKVNMRNGQFGRAYAGYGTDETYSLGGSLNFFSPERRVTVLGLGNNVNQQNFSSEDLLGVMSGGGSGRRGRGGRGGGGGSGRGGQSGGGGNDFMTNQQGGVSETQGFGINYNEDLSEKLSLSGNYFYNKTNNRNGQLAYRETFLGNDSSQFYQENGFSNSVNNNHRLNMRLEYKIDEANAITFSPRVSVQTNEAVSLGSGKTTSQTGGLINASTTDYRSDNTGYNLSGDLLFRHRFEKRGRTLSLNLSSKINESDGEAYQQASNNYYLNDRQDSLNQFMDNNGKGYTYSGNLSYSEPIGERMQLQMGYNLSRSHSTSDKETYDYDPAQEQRMGLDTALSNNFENIYTTHKPSLSVMYRMDKLMIRGEFSYQHATLSNSQIFPFSDDFNHTFETLLPGLTLRYRISDSKNINMSYRPSTNAPSISQLQDVVNNTDPLFLTSGNTSLDQSKVNMLTTRYSSTNMERATTFFLMAMISNTNDYITNTTYIAERDSVLSNGIVLNRGSQLSTPVNIDGYWNVRTFSSYGLPINFIKSNLNTSLGFTYARIPGFTNAQKNISNTYNMNAGFVLASNISENVDFTISYTLDYTLAENTLQTGLENDYFSQKVGSKLNLIFGKGFVFRNELNYIKYSGYSDPSLNDYYLLWNASIGKKFLKNNRGELSISVFDLLGENTSISRTNTESYFEETRTDVLQQYFMATFTYTIRNFKEQLKS